MNKGKKPPQGYVNISYVAKKCNDSGVKVNPDSIKFRFDKGEIAGIRELDDKKRRLVAIHEIPEIIMYFQKVWEVKNKKRNLCDLARDLGIKEGTMYEIAKRRGVQTARWGNMEVLSEKEYEEWKSILEKERDEREKYLSTGEIADYLGISRYLVIYHIKKGRIQAQRIGDKYYTPKETFEKNKEEWKRKYGKNP